MRHKVISQKDILYLSISMFAIVVAWIAFSIYHSYVTTTISEDLQMKIIPINPSFDTATIQALKSRQKITPLFNTNQNQKGSTPATPSATPTPAEVLPTEELLPTEIPSATQSGTTIAP